MNKIAPEFQGEIGKKTCFSAGMDAINSLPDTFSLVFKKVAFTNQDFTNIQGKMWPKPHIWYAIGEAAGVACVRTEIVDVYRVEDLSIFQNDAQGNMMLFGGVSARYNTGARATKVLQRRTEDGTMQKAEGTNEFDWFTRAKIDMLKDIEFNKNKLKTPSSRMLKMEEAKKFGLMQAETKAYIKSLRQLLGLPTGFEQADLRDGYLTVSKIVFSNEYLKTVNAAALSSASGVQMLIAQTYGSAELLTGEAEQIQTEALPAPTQDPIEEAPIEIIDDVPDDIFSEASPQAQAVGSSTADKILKIVDKYGQNWPEHAKKPISDSIASGDENAMLKTLRKLEDFCLSNKLEIPEY